MQAQLESRAGLAELPGLRARVTTLQQRLQDAQQDAAAAQQAAAAVEQQLAHTRQELQEANKVRTLTGVARMHLGCAGGARGFNMVPAAWC